MTATSAPFTGRKMLFSILTFFGVIIAANMTMMGFALTTHTGMVVPNSYVASQDFNKHIAADAAQRALGWQAQLSANETGIEVKFVDKAGTALHGLKVEGMIGRPVTAAEDQRLILAEKVPGAYTAPASLAPGDWRLDATARTADGQTFRIIKTIYLKAATQ